VLSGGEKSRVALLKLLLKPVNLLILDEPTNHLDMHSKDVLLEALKDFGGTVIFVSHDRGFIEELSTRVLELKPGHFRTFPGDYRYYMERINAESIMQNAEFEGKSLSPGVQASLSPTPHSPGAGAPSPQGCHTDSELLRNSTGKVVSDARLSYEEKKKFEAEKRKAEKLVKSIEDEIARIEEEKSIEENKMANPEVYSNGEKAKAVQERISELSAKLDDLNARWEEAALKLEEFNS
jgi:ATP-binding cassette subfamily F protein 3